MTFFYHKKKIIKIALCVFATMATSHAMQVPSTQEREAMNREFAAFEQDAQAIAQEMPAIEREMPEIERELNEPTTSFMDTLLIKTPGIISIVDAPDIEASMGIGVHVKDLVVIASWLAEYGLDWYLYKHFKEFSVTNVTDNIMQKHDALLPVLNKLTYQEDSEELLLDENLYELTTFFKKECFVDLNLKRTLTSQLLTKMIIYLLSYECINGIKYAAVGQDQNIFETFWQGLQTLEQDAQAFREGRRTNRQKNYTLAFTTFAHRFKMMADHTQLSRFLSGYSDLLTTVTRFFNSRHKFLDSHIMQLTKQFFIMTYFSVQLNDLFQDLWIRFIYTHTPQLKALLNNYARAKAQRNAKEIESIKNHLTELVLKGHTHSFLEWVRFKNLAWNKTNAVIETLFAIPLFYKAGKTIYNFTQTI